MEALDVQQLESLLYGLLAAIGIVLALLIGYVVLANRRQRDKMTAAYEADRLAPLPARRVSGQILSLVRNEAGGALGVEIGGEVYAGLVEIEDLQLRRQVVGAALELIQFTGALGQTETAPHPAPLDATSSWREDLRESSRTELERIHSSASAGGNGLSATQGADLVEAQFLNQLEELGQAPPPEKPSMAGALRRRRQPKKVEEEGSPGFVDEIEAIVQRRLRTVPALAGRDLHVRLGDGGLVRFVFDGTEYERLEEIPNLTAQQLVRDAIAEWDERH